MSIEIIAVGVDDSPGSRAALDWAADLALGLGAEIVAVHCFEPLAHLEELKPGTDLRSLRSAAERELEEVLCAPLRERSVRHRAVLREGEPAGVLGDVARESGADLVVVGARRRGPWKDLILGSTSRKLSQAAQVPLTIVPLPPS